MSKPLEPRDVVAVFDLFSSAQLTDVGEVVLERDDIEGAWARPSFDLRLDSLGMWERRALVAAAFVFRGRRADAAVHPGARGRGLGTHLADWVESRARAVGSPRVGQTVPSGSSAEAFLAARGYREGWTSWLLHLPVDTQLQEHPLPAGYSLRYAEGREDHEAAFRLIEDAFNEWPDRSPSTFEDWAADHTDRPGFQPWQLQLIEDRQGTPVGACFSALAGEVGYVDQIAVRGDQRGRGLAKALLAAAFSDTRRRGAKRNEVNTDSRTGAFSLYEHLGMRPRQTWRHWMTEL